MNDIELSVFNLVGGTALSLMMGHRKSIDIDLFIDRDFNVQHLASHLSKTYHAEGMKTLKNGIFCYINDVKIDLIAHQYPILNPLKIEDGIRMLSLEDISAMKLSAILNSGRRLKDFVDMHFLLEKLPIEKRAQIIRMLIKGNSLRLTSRMADVSINTVNKLLIDTGKACQQFHNDTVVKVKSKRVHADEIWSFVDSKEKNTSAEMKEQGKGDAWTWVGIDADSKLVISWQVDDKNADAACAFMYDIADRLANRVQLTTDGHMAYLDAVERAFDNDIDYAQLVKIYGGSEGGNENERKYSPAVCTGSKKTTVTGEPNPKFVNTSYVERQNLTMRMHMRRFTRLTNAFSKKIENHCYAIALHFVYYNFAKIHKTLSVTPAMQAGLTKRVMSIEDIANLASIEAPKEREAFKKTINTK